MIGEAGRVRALVTGGTSGLGLAMASALAAAGHQVVLTGRDGERARSTAAALPGATGLALDVTDETTVTAAVETAWPLDLLVNNAGLGLRTVNPAFLTDPMPFWEVPPDGFRAVVEANLTGYFLLARAVVPRMLAGGGGRVVNIAVSESTMRRAGTVPYGPSRAGSESLSRIMAAELQGSGVTVNLLLPGGPTLTGMVPVAPPGRSFLDPSVMGPPIVWLASPEAAGVHDERIVADGFEDWLACRS
jgi:NAD(P)-dependent dehydrogenase (short-subunit alcohol dehydrogenase family)